MPKIKFPDNPTHEDLIRFWLEYESEQRELDLLRDREVSGERPCDGDVDKVIRWWLEWMRINELSKP